MSDDNELPGTREHADFTGGDPDERSYAERERAAVKKTAGLLALERFVDNIGRYMESSEVDTDAWNDAVDNWSTDLGDAGREGMSLLIRVAMAAREWDKATEPGASAALRRCVRELNEWEAKLGW